MSVGSRLPDVVVRRGHVCFDLRRERLQIVLVCHAGSLYRVEDTDRGSARKKDAGSWLVDSIGPVDNHREERKTGVDSYTKRALVEREHLAV